MIEDELEEAVRSRPKTVYRCGRCDIKHVVYDTFVPQTLMCAQCGNVVSAQLPIE